MTVLTVFAVILIVAFNAYLIGAIRIETEKPNPKIQNLLPISDEAIPEENLYIASTTAERGLVYAKYLFGEKIFSFISAGKIYISLEDGLKEFGVYSIHVFPIERGEKPRLVTTTTIKTLVILKREVWRTCKVVETIYSPNISFAAKDTANVGAKVAYVEMSEYYRPKRRSHDKVAENKRHFRIINQVYTPAESYLNEGTYETAVLEIFADGSHAEDAAFIYSKPMFRYCRVDDQIFLTEDGVWHF